jgi:hypothetical protein
MSTFTDKQQAAHRKAFSEECRQKAWNASCNATYISNHFDKLMEEYEKLKREDAECEEQIKVIDAAPDYHTKDNRDKRKALQERRTGIARALEYVKQTADQAHQNMQQLYAQAEKNLDLAKHAETWEWKEVSSTSVPRE